jgi:hypothetical protein
LNDVSPNTGIQFKQNDIVTAFIKFTDDKQNMIIKTPNSQEHVLPLINSNGEFIINNTIISKDILVSNSAIINSIQSNSLIANNMISNNLITNHLITNNIIGNDLLLF